MDLRYLRATRLTKSQAGSRPWSPSSRRRSAAPARAGWSGVTRRALAVPRQGPISGAGDAPRLLTWAHGIGASGPEPSSATVGARIACPSSYHRFLTRMNVATSNPCEALERPKATQAVARGLSSDEVRGFLGSSPTPSPADAIRRCCCSSCWPAADGRRSSA